MQQFKNIPLELSQSERTELCQNLNKVAETYILCKEMNIKKQISETCQMLENTKNGLLKYYQNENPILLKTKMKDLKNMDFDRNKINMVTQKIDSFVRKSILGLKQSIKNQVSQDNFSQMLLLSQGGTQKIIEKKPFSQKDDNFDANSKNSGIKDKNDAFKIGPKKVRGKQ